MAGGFRGRDPRGITGFRNTILGAVGAGRSLQQTVTLVRDLYDQLGQRYTIASERALVNLYTQFQGMGAAAQRLSRVRNNIPITEARWINYSTLGRSLERFNKDPSYMVRYRVTGTLDGAPVDRWKTAYYGPSLIGTTIGDLKDDLQTTALDTATESLSEAELHLSEISLNAI